MNIVLSLPGRADHSQHWGLTSTDLGKMTHHHVYFATLVVMGPQNCPHLVMWKKGKPIMVWGYPYFRQTHFWGKPWQFHCVADGLCNICRWGEDIKLNKCKLYIISHILLGGIAQPYCIRQTHVNYACYVEQCLVDYWQLNHGPHRIKMKSLQTPMDIPKKARNCPTVGMLHLWLNGLVEGKILRETMAFPHQIWGCL